MRMLKTVLLVSLSVLSLPAIASYGDPFEGSGFVSEDWQLVCDNTLTCRAAGYSSEVVELRGSIMMTLPAGEQLPTTQVILNYWDDSEEINARMKAQNHQVELWLDDRYYGSVQLSGNESGTGELTASQTRQLIRQARSHTKIVFKLGDDHWQVSDTGMTAILLKLDDVQGRVGSPLALVSQNNPKRQNLKPAQSIPKIYAASTYPAVEYGHNADDLAEKTAEQKVSQRLSERYDRQWQSKMTKWAIATLDSEARDDCNILTSDQTWFDKEDKVWRFIPIDSTHTLVSHPCWTGAYNFGSGYWLVNNANPSQPKLITISGSDYSNGEIFSAHKGRGLGDCWSMASWTWNGETFAKSREQTTGLCRLIQAGGAWDLPTYISEVISFRK